MVRPPVKRAPSLNDLLPGLQRQIEAGDMRAPGGEAAANLAADAGRLAGERSVLFRVHQHFINVDRRSTKRGRLLNGLGFHHMASSCEGYSRGHQRLAQLWS